MKIASKLTFLITFLLLSLLVNTLIGLYQLYRVGDELREVAQHDTVIMEIVTSISQHQLEKAILFQKTIRIAEEMAFENISVARREHLLDNLEFIQKGFNKLANEGATRIVEGKKLLSDSLKQVSSGGKNVEMGQVTALLSKIEDAHIRYDSLIRELFFSLNTKGYQMSLEDIDRIQNEERDLIRDGNTVIEKIQQYMRLTTQQAEYAQEVARRTMWVGVISTVIIALIFTFSILRRMSGPFRNLIQATQKVGKGDFAVNLDASGHDEIGEVSRAFNLMSRQLDTFSTQLENRNKELAQSLSVTEGQKKDLEKVNAELDRFVHTVSHDIGAPLRGIAWYGNQLADKYLSKLDEKGREAVSGVCEGAERLDGMIQDLLELTRISRVKNPYERMDMGVLIYSVLERLEFDIKDKNVDLKIQDNMPQVVCDRIKMGTVFQNLINNAIKFSSKNSNSPKIELGFFDKEGAFEFFVKDNGIGIDPAYHEQVFEMFRRLHTSKEYEGFGAGLSIVKAIIEDQGGKIWIDSKVDHGATFIFTIPKGLKEGNVPLSI